MIKNKTMECSRCFIERIDSPSRKSKRVSLLDQRCSGAIDDPIWIQGALATTALRKRPNNIEKPKYHLGYRKAKTAAINAARKLIECLRSGTIIDYEKILMSACKELDDEIRKLDIYWNFGRSQKFFNILTKYWFCVAEGYPDALKNEDLNLISRWCKQFHAPVDSITLRHIRSHEDAPILDGVYWGWNMDEHKYFEIQSWIKRKAVEKDLSPIGYELIYIWVNDIT
jgi:hypothetical protein